MSRGIGTLAEGHLHATLKALACGPEDRCEVAVEGLVVDVAGPGGIVEIQTGGFSRLRAKLERLLPTHPLRVVLPIAAEKTIVRLEEGAEGRRELSRRRSPKRGVPAHAFKELVSIATWLLHPNLTLEILLTREEELRVLRPGRAWRRQGWVVLERRLIEVLESHVLCGVEAWRRWLPGPDLPAFDSAELAATLGASRAVGQQACYTLHQAGLLCREGKRGRAWLYQSSPDR